MKIPVYTNRVLGPIRDVEFRELSQDRQLTKNGTFRRISVRRV